jgi:PST family polysaccharide transporter
LEDSNSIGRQPLLGASPVAVASDGPPNFLKRMDHGSKQSVARGVAWQGIAQWGCQILTFGIFTGLARLLSPKVFGLVAIAGVYLAFVQLLVNQDFGTAIIQRRDLEREHLDSAFWISTASAVFFCGLSILLASTIAHIFREPKLSAVIGWLSLSFPLGALGSTPNAILTREFEFRPLAIRSLIATGVGGAVGLAMAFFGCGVWSLVGQQLVGGVIGCACLWVAVPWRPGLRISKRHLRDLYGFSLNTMGAGILWFFAQKSDQSVVGYGFGSSGLGPYALASRVSTLLHDGIIGPLQSVAFPAFSKLQSDPLKLERAVHRFCELSAFVGLPALGGIIVVAPELVRFLFGSKWTSAVPLLQILAAYSCVRVLLAFVNPTMLAKGRTGLSLVMEIVLASLTLAGCLVALRWNPKAVALSVGVTLVLVGLLQVTVISVQVLDARPAALLKTYLFPVSSTVLMGVVVALMRAVLIKALSPVETLFICVATGAAVYGLTALAVRRDIVRTIWQMAGGVSAIALHSVRLDSLKPDVKGASTAAVSP